MKLMTVARLVPAACLAVSVATMAQTTAPAWSVSSPIRTPLASMSVTAAPVRTSTPRFSRACRA